MKRRISPEKPSAARIHAIGAKVSMRRIIIPAKYHETVPERTKKRVQTLISLKRRKIPTGASGTTIWRSRKKVVHVVG